VAAQTVRGLGPDNPRHGAEAGLPCGEARWSAHAQGRRRFPTAPGSCSRKGPCRVEEILGFVLLDRQAIKNVSKRRRVEEM
jgi:hypothetical protein